MGTGHTGTTRSNTPAGCIHPCRVLSMKKKVNGKVNLFGAWKNALPLTAVKISGKANGLLLHNIKRQRLQTHNVMHLPYLGYIYQNWVEEQSACGGLLDSMR